MLILPGDPLFADTLACPPPNWQAIAASNSGRFAIVARAGSGILEAVPQQEVDEYLEGGEYAERLLESDQTEDYLNAFGAEEELQEFYELEFVGDSNNNY